MSTFPYFTSTFDIDYMKQQLAEANDPDFLYRAWPEADGKAFLILEYRIIRRTPKGCWTDSTPARFVNLSWNKRWACPTRTEAVESLLRRMRSWETILQRDLNKCQTMQKTLAELKAAS